MSAGAPNGTWRLPTALFMPLRVVKPEACIVPFVVPSVLRVGR
jgi:hypothetical protein